MIKAMLCMWLLLNVSAIVPPKPAPVEAKDFLVEPLLPHKATNNEFALECCWDATFECNCAARPNPACTGTGHTHCVPPPFVIK